MNPKNLTEKQISKLKKLAGVMDNGNIAVLEHLFEIEEKIDEAIPTLENIVGRFKGDKGEKGDSIKGEDGYTPIKGKDYFDGEDYVLTERDKKEIAKSIQVPIVEKVIEKRETVIRELPVVTKEIIEKEVAVLDDATVAYLEEEIRKVEDKIPEVVKKNTTNFGFVIRDVVAGSGVTIDKSDPNRPVVSASGTGGGHTIEDEGTPLTQRDTLNFVGAGVTVTDAGGKTVVTVSGGGSGAVDSVNGETGVVTLTTDDISDAAQTNKWATAAEKTKLGHISVTQAVDLDAIETASHAALTVTDSAEIDFTLTGQDLTASIKTGSIDETKLDASTNASLDLADSASQPGHTHTASNVTDFTEAAQDAAGAMVDTSLVYADATPLLSRAALTGAITASQGSNTTALGSFTKAQLDAAVSDGNVMYIGDAPTSHTHTLASITDVTASATEVNVLDGIPATLTATELGYMDGVTSSVQSQIDAKPTISSGAGAPASTPTKVGDIYIDTTGDDAYIAVGTASSADWEKSNDGAGGGLSDGDKGDITVSGSGATWTIDNGVVSLAKQADVATASVFYRKTAGTGAPEVQTLATLKTDLGLTGTNSGDQTTIVGITGTKAQFDTAVTDGNFLYVGDVTSNATHTGDVTGSTALTLDPTAITGKATVTAVGTDYVLISDTSDSGLLKKALASDLAGSGGVSDGDKGDITISGSGTVYTIDNNSVTFAKIQAITDGVLLGASGGTVVEEITIGSGLSLAGNTLTATGGGGVTLGAVMATSQGFNMV